MQRMTWNVSEGELWLHPTSTPTPAFLVSNTVAFRNAADQMRAEDTELIQWMLFKLKMKKAKQTLRCWRVDCRPAPCWRRCFFQSVSVRFTQSQCPIALPSLEYLTSVACQNCSHVIGYRLRTSFIGLGPWQEILQSARWYSKVRPEWPVNMLTSSYQYGTLRKLP